MSNCEEDVNRIKKKLEKMIKNNDVDVNTSIDMLNVLKNLQINLQILQNTRIGVVVNNLRKCSTSDEMGTLAKNLLKSWKKLVSNEGSNGNNKNNTLSPNSNFDDVNMEKDNSNSIPTSPPILTSNSSSSSSSFNNNNNNNNNNSNVTQTSSIVNAFNFSSNNSKDLSKQNSTEILSSSSSSSTTSSSSLSSTTTAATLSAPSLSSSNNQKQNITRNNSNNESNKKPSFTRNSSSTIQYTETKDQIRLKSRELLVSALHTTDVIENGVKLADSNAIAARCEDIIFAEFGNTDAKYRNRIRSRIANLKDPKNPKLRESVLLSLISPDRLATMSAEEMASDELKQLRQKFTKESIDDHQMAVNAGSKTSLLKCKKCKGSNCSYSEMQTRSADEPMTVFAYCLDCGCRWKQ